MSFFFYALLTKRATRNASRFDSPPARPSAWTPQTLSNHPSWLVSLQGGPDHSFLTPSPSNITPAGPYDAFPFEAGPYEEYGSATDSASSLFGIPWNERLAFPDASVHGMVQNEIPNSRLLQPLGQTLNPGNFPTDDPEPWKRILPSDSIAVNGEYLLIPEIGPWGASLSHDEDTCYAPNRITQHKLPNPIAYPNVASRIHHPVFRTESVASGKDSASCGAEVASLYVHDSVTGDAAYACSIRECTGEFHSSQGIFHHMRTAHPELRSCSECGAAFSSRHKLSEHAEETGHAAFICGQSDCGSAFSRYDTYERHLKIHEDDAKRYACPHCKKHRGVNGFKRKDHLTQHLRNYHHIGEYEARSAPYLGGKSCPHKDCSEWRPKSVWVKENAFQTTSEYTKHMKKVHDESPFPCPEPECDRIGGKGYYRRRDLFRHQKKEHSMNVGREEGEEVE